VLTRARVIDVDGQLVLDDPDALAVMRAVAKHNCRKTLLAQAERVRHFERRMSVLGVPAKDAVIVVINADDRHGRVIADMLMPGHDWSEIRARGELAYARGLAGRLGMTSVVESMDLEEGIKLRAFDGACVVVMDHGHVAVFDVKELGKSSPTESCACVDGGAP
jgi:hypothetical protein